MGFFTYTSRLKSCLQKTSPPSQCPECSLQDASYTSWLKWCLRRTPLTNPRPVCSAWDACFIHTGSNCARGEVLQETPTLTRMSLWHTQAEIVPTGNYSHKFMPSAFSIGKFSYTSRLKWCLRKTPTNSCPLCSLCFFYTSMANSPTTLCPVRSLHNVSLNIFRLKCCLQGTLPQNHAQYTLLGIFLLHMHAKI